MLWPQSEADPVVRDVNAAVRTYRAVYALALGNSPKSVPRNAADIFAARSEAAQLMRLPSVAEGWKQRLARSCRVDAGRDRLHQDAARGAAHCVSHRPGRREQGRLLPQRDERRDQKHLNRSRGAMGPQEIVPA